MCELFKLPRLTAWSYIKHVIFKHARLYYIVLFQTIPHSNNSNYHTRHGHLLSPSLHYPIQRYSNFYSPIKPYCVCLTPLYRVLPCPKHTMVKYTKLHLFKTVAYSTFTYFNSTQLTLPQRIIFLSDTILSHSTLPSSYSTLPYHTTIFTPTPWSYNLYTLSYCTSPYFITLYHT